MDALAPIAGRSGGFAILVREGWHLHPIHPHLELEAAAHNWIAARAASKDGQHDILVLAYYGHPESLDQTERDLRRIRLWAEVLQHPLVLCIDGNIDDADQHHLPHTIELQDAAVLLTSAPVRRTTTYDHWSLSLFEDRPVLSLREGCECHLLTMKSLVNTTLEHIAQLGSLSCNDHSLSTHPYSTTSHSASNGWTRRRRSSTTTGCLPTSTSHQRRCDIDIAYIVLGLLHGSLISMQLRASRIIKSQRGNIDAAQHQEHC